jgi:hypothetical protein
MTNYIYESLGTFIKIITGSVMIVSLYYLMAGGGC